MLNRKKRFHLIETIARLAPKVGSKVLVEPKWGAAAQIVYKNGIVRSFRGSTLDISNTGSANVAKDTGLRFAGVDLMMVEGDITQNPKVCNYCIIEINSSPGFNHYVAMGEKQKKVVEAMCF